MALATNRSPERLGTGQPSLLTLPVAAGANIPGGALVAKPVGSAFVTNATAATGLVIVGAATDRADNTTGSAGAITVDVECGVFDCDIGTAGDALTTADVLNDVYCIDNNTVGKTSGGSTRSIAGKLLKIENGRAYVAVQAGL